MSKILIIEPDALLASTYMAALAKHGHKVCAVSSAQAALDAADGCEPEIILLELQLVAHSGVEFLYEFRSYPEWQAIPVIIVSHVPPAEFKHSAGVLESQLGVIDYHYKPHVSLQKLLRIVETVAVRG